VNWQEFNELRLPLGDDPSREQWQAALDHAESLLPLVDDADREAARGIIGDTLIQTGIWLGYVDDEDTP
jgi:hypothetical protein